MLLSADRHILCFFFPIQQPLFPLQAACIAGELAAAAEDPVTGNENGNGIMSHRVPHRLSGHMRNAPAPCDFCGKGRVACGLPIGDAA